MNEMEKNTPPEVDNPSSEDKKRGKLDQIDEHGETLKGKIKDWILFALICVIVVVFGRNKLFNRMGPISLLILFGIVVVLSFFLIHIIAETEESE